MCIRDRVYGELINAFGYGLTPDDKFLDCLLYTSRCVEETV